jgi:hypothetical protein
VAHGGAAVPSRAPSPDLLAPALLGLRCQRLETDCRPDHQASFVADVTVDQVLVEALDLLATETAKASAG